MRLSANPRVLIHLELECMSSLVLSGGVADASICQSLSPHQILRLQRTESATKFLILESESSVMPSGGVADLFTASPRVFAGNWGQRG